MNTLLFSGIQSASDISTTSQLYPVAAAVTAGILVSWILSTVVLAVLVTVLAVTRPLISR